MSLRQPTQLYEPSSTSIDNFSRRIIAHPNNLGVQSDQFWDFQSPQQYYLSRRQRVDQSEPRMQNRPQFRSKVVCVLDCKHCDSEVCRRGMKAILLADMNVRSVLNLGRVVFYRCSALWYSNYDNRCSIGK
jgi:hypothetical protein